MGHHDDTTASVPLPDAVGHLWAVELDVAMTLTMHDGTPVDRDEFFGWLWGECGDRGLLGIDEGAVGSATAAALGLAATPRVVDAAAAPPDRDWVGGLDTQAATSWFADESAAHWAADLVATVAGCVVRGIRPVAAASADWRDSFTPIVVPGFGVVRPAWQEGSAGTEAGLTTMFIEPGCGFGTGEHETTRLCLIALAERVQAGGRVARVLDFGSGSGILAIAAALRGADRVEAVEIDGRTHDAIRENCRRNGVEAQVGVLAELPDPGAAYDLVFANIVPAVLLEYAERLCERVGRGGGEGCLVLSGLGVEEVGPVAERYAQLLASTPVRTSLGAWHCLRFTVGR